MASTPATQPRSGPLPGQVRSGKPPLGPPVHETAPEAAFVRLDCSWCSAAFLLDVEEHWRRETPEMEVVGRKFLGLSPDAVLCPRCLHEAESAGAERIYWALACG